MSRVNLIRHMFLKFPFYVLAWGVGVGLLMLFAQMQFSEAMNWSILGTLIVGFLISAVRKED